MEDFVQNFEFLIALLNELNKFKKNMRGEEGKF